MNDFTQTRNNCPHRSAVMTQVPQSSGQIRQSIAKKTLHAPAISLWL
jgi:hypothetical protein